MGGCTAPEGVPYELTEQLRERGVPILYPDKHPHAGGPDCYAVFSRTPPG